MKKPSHFKYTLLLTLCTAVLPPSPSIMAQEPTDDEYNAALNAINTSCLYRIFTQFNGTSEATTKYYLTDHGYLTESQDEAHTFSFENTYGSSLYRSPGWQLDVPFTNPVVSNDGRGDMLLDGHLHTNTRRDLAWEGQLWFKQGDRYAVRSTNANSNTWGASTYWSVIDRDADGLPEAEYALSASYVFQLEKVREQSVIEIDETNFPDENFRNYLLDLSYGDDDKLTEREIAKITSLSLNNQNIQSLQGIEFFTSLTSLYCYGNQLTSLNISNNTELQYLQCGYNKLTALDLSENPYLRYLYCYGNQLTSLDVSNNPFLSYFYCGNNQLESLDVTNNTELNTLSCYSNKLTSLDVSNNIYLTDLQCTSNQLESLNLQNNPSLLYLSCGYNSLTTLDLSQNTALTEVYCQFNEIYGDGMDALIANLPTANFAKLYFTMSLYGDDNEYTLEQVTDAKKRGWTVYTYTDSGWEVIVVEKVLITDVSQLSSPYTDPSDPSKDALKNLKNLIDNDASTFWHSNWHDGAVTPGLHYFQVEMPDMEDTDFIRFKFTRRNTADDHTTLWGVYGTNDFDAAKEQCTLLGEFSTPFGSQTETITSEAFCHQGYKYLRFYSEAQYGTANAARGFFHLAEFQLYPVKELITDVSQLTSPYTDPSEGSLDALIDADTSTFWHSDWHSTDVTPGLHFFQVQMPDMGGMDYIKFQFTRRDAANNQVTLWSVYATDNPEAEKSQCIKLGDFTTPFTSTTETLQSDPFPHESYKYLRFYAEQLYSKNGSTPGYFHLAEFQLYPVAGVQDTEPADPSCLVINEIQVANIDQFIDPSFNYGGWIEIYNPSSKAINLADFYLSDDADDLTKFQLPADIGKVKPRGYITIWFDHHDVRGGNEYSSLAYKQVPWKLTYEGGEVFLSNSDGTLLISQNYPLAIQRCSYARTADGADTWSWSSTPTPGASNAGSLFAATQLPPPEVDTDASLFTTPFTFNVAIPDGCTLHYTTDGSTPTMDNGFQTTDGTFYVDESTHVYRFRLYGDGYLPSAVVTRSYIYKDQDYYLPIISVVTDDANLYGSEYGAYIRGGSNGVPGNGISYSSNTNRAWERPVNFEYIVPDPDGGSFLMALNQECDFEVCGGWSRNLYSPMSSFRLKAGKYYLGQNFLPYSFFEDKPYIKSKTLHVRNGGNDGYARIKDAGLHEIILRSGFYADCQTSQPAHVFINGQYKMMFNIREPNNKNHGYSNYGIDTDDMDQFELNSERGYQQKTGDFQMFSHWIDLAGQLGSDPTNHAIYQQICDIVDIDEYCNFMAVGCYVGCSDWLTNSNNVKGYRSRQDGKFHLIFMDVDGGFSNSDMIGSIYNKWHSYDSRYPYIDRSYLIDIFFNMLQYEPFKKKFIDAFCIVDGSVYESQFSQQVFNSLVQRAAPAMAIEGLEGNLQSSATEMLNNIIYNRNSRMANMESYFGNLSSPKSIKFSSNLDCASFEINRQPVPRAQFDGRLYAPATINAMAPAGYRFKGWQQEGGHVVTGNTTEIFPLTQEPWQYYDGPKTEEINDRSWIEPSVSLNWSNGPSPFGYGAIGWSSTTADYKTELKAFRDGDDTYNNSSNKYPSYYFRKTFNIDGTPTDNTVYTLTCYVDDGCVVYVNGNEVGRYLMDDGTPTYGQYSTTFVEHQGAKLLWNIPTEYLKSGENLIAVEVHNTSANSSDIYWTAKLTCSESETTTGSVVCETPELDITTVADGVTLTAVFERMADADLMAELAMPVRVNEISAANSIFVNDHFKKNDWVELYNTTDTDIDAARLYLSDDIEDPLKYQIPSSAVASTIIPAHGRLIVWSDKLAAKTQLHTPFKLGNGSREVLLITSSDEFVANNADFFAAHPTLTDFADGLVYSTHRGDQSVGRYPDGGNNYFMMNLPTIAKNNLLLSFDEAIGTDKGVMENVNRKAVFDLVQGWNWVSHPLTESVSVNTFKDKASVIQSQTLEAYYSSSTGAMAGPLRKLDAGRLYKIEMEDAGRYELDGHVLFNQPPMSLRAGWNWIGFYGTASQTLSEAFDGQNIEEGDVIVGQSGFSEYVNGTWTGDNESYSENGWVGELSSLTPGQGYMYKSVSAKGVRMNVKSSSMRLRRDAGRVGKDRFGVDRHAWPNVMGVIATLQLDGNIVDTEGITVLAYSDDECRGYGRAIGGRLFLTFYGDGGETLTLKAVSDDGTEFSIVEHFDFVSDVIGSFKAPVVLHLGEATPTDIAATPATATRSVASPVGYYSLSGSFLGNSTATLRPGIYVVRMSDASARKLIVK